MENSWPTVRIGDYCSKIGSGATPRGGSSVYKDSGEICLVRSQNIYNNGFKFDGLVYIDEGAATKLKNVVLEPNDILLNITGDSVARVCLVDERVLPARVNQHVAIIRPNPSDFDARFLRYYLASPYAQAVLLNLASAGATRNALTKSMIENFEAPKPSIDVQSKIADHLEALELKVLSNQDINKTLEQMAQALFKSWFVDFAPVIDNALATGNDIPEALQHKAEQRKQAQQLPDFKPLPDDIRALFPSEFEQTGEPTVGIDGWIPKSWKVKNIGSLNKINPESWTKKNAPESVKYVDLANAKNGTILDTVDYTFEEAPSRARRVLRQHDIIIGVVRPANRSFAYVNENGLTGSTGFAVVRALNESYRAFTYLSLTNDDSITEFARIADGAAYPAIKPEDVSNALCIYSSDEILKRFEDLAGQYLLKKAANERQLKPMTEIRDVLLPKLISGELQLPDTELQAEYQ